MNVLHTNGKIAGVRSNVTNEVNNCQTIYFYIRSYEWIKLHLSALYMIILRGAHLPNIFSSWFFLNSIYVGRPEGVTLG